MGTYDPCYRKWLRNFDIVPMTMMKLKGLVYLILFLLLLVYMLATSK